MMAGGYKRGVADIAALQSKAQDQGTSLSVLGGYSSPKDYSGPHQSGRYKRGRHRGRDSLHQEPGLMVRLNYYSLPEKLEGVLSAGLRQPK